MAGTLDARSAVSFYVERMLNDISGMKVLILDKETTGIVSMVYSQSQILEREVFLVENLHAAEHERMMHLKAVVFVRPTRGNVQAMRQELSNPKYGEYHVFFSNMVPQDLLSQLADADEHEVVKQVQEYYADWYAVNSDTFTLNIANSMVLSRPRPQWSRDEESIFQRSTEGLLSVLLSFKKRPAIRFQRSSDLAHSFARELFNQIDRQHELFDFRQGPSTLLLILDRRDDPVTPLLTQWTYQAMVHELLGIHTNRVDMSKTPGVREDLREVVLSEGDAFFKKHMYSNFGDLGVAVKALLDSYQAQFKTNKNIQSVEDMQRFVESYPEFKKFATNVSKHVAVMSELARLVDTHRLLDMSQLEQELACASDHSAQLDELKTKLSDPSISKVDAVRLVLLYALRYETYGANRIGELKGMLRSKGVIETDVKLVDTILGYSGSAKRGGDLYGEKTMMAKAMKMGGRAIKGVSNVYTQHTPLLAETLDLIQKGRLKETAFPFVAGGGAARERPRDVIVFIMGGVTFEEAAKISELNAAETGMRILLGGTCVHNSKSFLAELAKTRS